MLGGHLRFVLRGVISFQRLSPWKATCRVRAYENWGKELEDTSPGIITITAHTQCHDDDDYVQWPERKRREHSPTTKQRNVSTHHEVVFLATSVDECRSAFSALASVCLRGVSVSAALSLNILYSRCGAALSLSSTALSFLSSNVRVAVLLLWRGRWAGRVARRPCPASSRAHHRPVRVRGGDKNTKNVVRGAA